MMFSNYYYHQLIKKYVIIFGILFDDMTIERTNAEDETTQVIKVPISYAPKDKVLSRLDADPKIDRPAAITLPRMSFEIGAFIPDPSRKLNPMTKMDLPSADPSKGKFIYAGMPYNIQFNLYVYVKNDEDGTKIIEQILPIFSPDYTITANLVEGFQPVDIPVILNNVSKIDTYEGSFDQRRAIIWTLTFTMKSTFFGPVKTKPLIKFIDSDLFACPDLTDSVAGLTVQPGLTANGDPTTILAESIPVANITANSNYGLIITRRGLGLFDNIE